jgi:hypothetical protein
MIDKIGKMFTTTGDDVWRMLEYQELPTMVLMNIDTGVRVSETLVSIKHNFVELRPVRELSGDPLPHEEWKKKSLNIQRPQT